MKIIFKKRVLRTISVLLIGFVVLFLFRFIYGYSTGLSEVREENFSDFFSSLEEVKRNYASDKYRFKVESSGQSNQGQAQEFDVNQKYEKTATIKSKSSKFDDDEKKLRDHIKSENGIIQYEENSGQRGSRSLHLLIGIPPAKFDSSYADLLKIGTIRSKEITKIDKTNEFKNLNAKKASLEITRQSLLEIKKQSGRIEEYINLQNRILEIEQELQGLGVLLGDFDAENEFCTIRFSLHEGRDIKVSTLHRIKVAFEWSVQYYLLFVAIAATASIFAFFFLLIIDKLIPGIITKINQ
ncbi:DUF4349 domain-containing protein [Ohtaekwangia koreensis]|uniref:DUF4349 domain-containing protein n=1 Tax=Ohtaekwangia koreensis TaxID=688867 RepID=A0A1T5LG65_9BACT|nr:DUF4349 domain-containing protein [Ohtaekwangia koreensis]SKC74368.1 protein of unknown function [Ohtaekwangia koreensis]